METERLFKNKEKKIIPGAGFEFLRSYLTCSGFSFNIYNWLSVLLKGKPVDTAPLKTVVSKQLQITYIPLVRGRALQLAFPFIQEGERDSTYLPTDEVKQVRNVD